MKNNFKKIMAMLLAVSMVMAFAACGKEEPKPTEKPAVTEETTVADVPDVSEDVFETESTDIEDENINTDMEIPTGTEFVDEEYVMSNAEMIVNQLYGKFVIDDLTVGVVKIDKSDAEVFKSYTGLASADHVAEAAVAEPMIGSIAYSMVVVRALPKDDANYVAPDALAEEMKAGIDTRKWICVEADDMDVAVNGEYVMLFMAASDFNENAKSEKITKAFTEMDIEDAIASIGDINDVTNTIDQIEESVAEDVHNETVTETVTEAETEASSDDKK